MSNRGGPAAGQKEGEGYPSGDEGFQVRPVHKQLFEERLCGATRDDQRSECQGCIPRTSAPSAGENQERTILQIAEQNGGDSIKRNQNLYYNITKIMDTPWKIAETYGIIWTSWSEKES